MKKATLYVKTGCPWCTDALSYFKKKQIELNVVDVLINENKMNELIEISGQIKTPNMKTGDFVVADFDLNEFEEDIRKNPEEAEKLGLQNLLP